MKQGFKFLLLASLLWSALGAQSVKVEKEIKRELYRYFIRKQDHTIVEVFGGIDKEVAEKAGVNL